MENTKAHTNTQNTHKYIQTHTNTQKPTQKHTHKHTNTITHTNTHTNGNTHKHTHNSTPLNHRQVGRTELHLSRNNTLKIQTSVSDGGIRNFNFDALVDTKIRNKC